MVHCKARLCFLSGILLSQAAELGGNRVNDRGSLAPRLSGALAAVQASTSRTTSGCFLAMRISV